MPTTTPFDRVKVTAASFTAYFIMSAVITPLGIVSQSMANHFSVDVTVTTAFFSYLTTGILVGASVSMLVYSVLTIRQLNVIAGTTLAFALAGLWLVDRLWLLPVLFSVAGFCCGLLLAAAVIVLTRSFSETSRARALLVTDSFYSGAGVIAGYLAGRFINEGLHWATPYALPVVVTIVLVLIAATSRFPEADTQQAEIASANIGKRWPASVFLVAAALLIYIISFIFIYSWVPAHAAQAFGATPAEGGSLVSRFFLGLFIGQLLSFGASFRLSLHWLIGILMVGATLATTAVWSVASLPGLYVSMLILGLLTGGVLKTLLTYGTLLVDHPSTRMVSFLVVSTAVGSSLGPATSALVVRLWGIEGALLAITAGYVTTSLLVVLTFATRGDTAERMGEQRG